MVSVLNLQKSWLKTYCTAGGIIAWLALGPKLGFGNEWQLDVNTATAVELMIMTTFLQNTKRRHRLYMHRCSAMLATIDQELEERLVTATHDCQVGSTDQMLFNNNHSNSNSSSNDNIDNDSNNNNNRSLTNSLSSS